MSLILNHAVSIFDNNNSLKWQSFLELVNFKDTIIKLWYKQLSDSIEERFQKPEWQEWKLRRWYEKSFGFQLTQYDPNSLAIRFHEGNYILWINPAYHNRIEILKKYRDSKLFTSYFHNSEVSENSSNLAQRANPITINGLNDVESLAWYAAKDHKGHEEMVSKLVEFFEHFMKDPEIVGIIREINQMKK